MKDRYEFITITVIAFGMSALLLFVTAKLLGY